MIFVHPIGTAEYEAAAAEFERETTADGPPEFDTEGERLAYLRGFVAGKRSGLAWCDAVLAHAEVR